MFKDKNDYFELGRWVAPVIEYEVWMDWCKTDDAKSFGLTPDDPAAIPIDGHYFLPTDGSYPKLRQQINAEFESGNFEVTTKILELAQKLGGDCIQMANNLESKITFEDFIQAFALMSKLRFPWMACFPIGDAGEEFVNQYALKNNLRVDEVGEIIPQLNNSLTDDQKELSRFKEQIEKEKLAFDIEQIEKTNLILANKIKEYQKTTEYIGTHHFWGDERSLDRLMEAIKNASLESKSEKVTKSNIKALEIIAEATKWRLECAQSSAFLAYKFRPYLTDLARQHSLIYDDLIFLLTSEIKDLIENNKEKEILPLIRERQKAMGMLKMNGNIQVAIGDELHQWKKHFGLLEVHEAVKEFKGAIGNKGIVQGVVVIVLRPTDQSKVQPGMILVAPETTPDFILSMGKAAAFVTDQGGITSHAAIVAREMGKPCIIGTKIATKVLKDGDLVEVDADKGIVKIIK